MAVIVYRVMTKISILTIQVNLVPNSSENVEKATQIHMNCHYKPTISLAWPIIVICH